MRVIYSYFSNNAEKYIISYLKEKCGWCPVYFHGYERMREWVEELYPEAILHDSMAMRKARFDYSQIGPPVPIDADIISSLSEYETTYLNWLEDTTGWNFSISERRRYYYDVLTFWNTVINILKPDLFVAYTWPHVPSDYPLYLLCKYHYSIPVLFLDPVPLLDNDFNVIGNSLENLSSPFEALYFSDTDLEITDQIKQYLKRMRSKRPSQPKFMKVGMGRLDRIRIKEKATVSILAKMIFGGTVFKKAEVAFKKNKEPMESEKSQFNQLEYVLFRTKLARKKRIVPMKY